MSDWSELKRLAEIARDADGCSCGSDEDYEAAAHPENILTLIAENERLNGQVRMLVRQHMPLEAMEDMPGWSQVVDAEKAIKQRDQAREEVEALRKDAERYRYLRHQGLSLEGHDFLSFDEIADQRIDDAMQKDRGNV